VRHGPARRSQSPPGCQRIYLPTVCGVTGALVVVARCPPTRSTGRPGRGTGCGVVANSASWHRSAGRRCRGGRVRCAVMNTSRSVSISVGVRPGAGTAASEHRGCEVCGTATSAAPSSPGIRRPRCGSAAADAGRDGASRTAPNHQGDRPVHKNPHQLRGDILSFFSRKRAGVGGRGSDPRTPRPGGELACQ
jgi:hypothetical protein